MSKGAEDTTNIDNGVRALSEPADTNNSPDLSAVAAAHQMSAPSATPPQAGLTDEVKDKDKSSLSTTLTGTNNTRVSRRNANNASENAPSSSTHLADEKTAAQQQEQALSKPAKSSSKANGKGKSGSVRSSKPSFIARMVRRLVPCCGPSSAHLLEDHPSAHNSSLALKEKQAEVVSAKDVPNHNPGPSQSPSNPTIPADPSALARTDTASSLPLATAPPIATSPTVIAEDAIIPPTKHLLPEEETEGVTSGAVQAPGSTGEENQEHHHVHIHPHTANSGTNNSNGHSNNGNESDVTGDEEYEDANGMEDIEDEEDRLIRQGGAGIPIGPDGQPKPLLPPIAPHHVGRKCLVLDLDETLVHSSFKSIQQADYIVPVEIDHHWHNFYVLKRPGVDEFLREMGLIYEVVVFTASLSVYADPVLDKLDIHQAVSHRLFRESCYNHKGNYVKDLSQLGRPMTDTIILDNSPASYIFHPNNAVPVSSWFNDPHDTELTDMSPFLADLQATDDIRGVLDAGI